MAIDLSNEIIASDITSGTISPEILGSGTADSTTYLRGDNTWNTISAGGLTKFVEAEATTSPNNTIYVDSITANGSTTNADLAIVPKGTGAFLLDIPDSSITGGNKRGTNAIDLQIVRASATQVASGNYSVGIGYGNTASNSHATAIGRENIASAIGSTSLGYTNTSSGSYATSSGFTNIASGNNSVAMGASNTASSTSSVAMGQSSIASGTYSTAIGLQNTASNTYNIAIGYANNASGSQATAIGSANASSASNSVSIGTSNSASGNYSFAIGQSCTASFANSVAIGYQCTASGGQSVAIGYNASATTSGPCVSIGYGTIANASGSLATGNFSNTYGVYGRHSHASGIFIVSGDAQKSTFILRRRTTDAISTILTTDGSGAVNASNYVSLQNNNVFRFKGSIVGKQTGTTNVGVWDIDGVIVRGANAASTTLTISNINLVTNASSWGTPTLTTDTTYGSLVLNVIGLAGTNIQWTALVETTEVIY